MKSAGIYHRKGRYLVHAKASTTEGLVVFSEPTFTFEDNVEPDELGRAIVVALDAFRAGVRHPRTSAEWKAVLVALLALGGVKTYSTFCKSARCVNIEEESERVVLTPTRNLGARGGFDLDLANQLFTTRNDPARLGAAAAEACRLST
jgi:hypothetical protein